MKIVLSDVFRQDKLEGEGVIPHLDTAPDFEIVQLQDSASLQKILKDVRLQGDHTVKIYEHAQIQLKKYKLAELNPTALYLLKPQLALQTDIFYSLHHRCSQNLFGLTGVMDYEVAGKTYRMVPPIIERYVEPTTNKEVEVILDGLHRLYVARQLGIEEAWVIEISGVPQELPPTPLPVSWDDIKLYDDVPPTDKKRRYRYTSPSDYPNMRALTSVPITQENYLYFLYRDFSVLGSSGVRTSK